MELKKITSLELEGIAPYDFEKTVQKYTLYGIEWYWLTPYEIFSKGVLWTAMRIDDIPIGLRLRSAGNVENPKVHISIFSKDRLSNDEENKTIDILTFILRLKEDISNFYILSENYEPLKQAKKDLYGMRITTNPSLFDLTLLAITLQMASYGRTEQMIRLIYENYGELLQFDDKKIVISPTPGKISEVSENELKVKCRVGYRATSIIENAKLISSGELPNLMELKNMSYEDAINSLMKMRGIGEYSREIILFALHPCFPVDAWSVNHFCRLFKIEIKYMPRDMIPILKTFAKKEFGKWQSYVFDYIINDLERLSTRFGLDF